MISTSIDFAQPVATQPTSQGEPVKVMIVTNAWEPQVNGVTYTLTWTRRGLEVMEHIVDMITPLEFKAVPYPTYPEIRLPILSSKHVYGRIKEFAPQALHIATEGPLGLAACTYALCHRLPYAAAYHTRFPEYIQARFGIPLAWTYRFPRWFHSPAQAVMASAPMVLKDLADYGITDGVLWTRGVDLDIFTAQRSSMLNTAHPVPLYIGHVAMEKSVEAFLELDLPGSKWVAGEGPALTGLRTEYPNTSYLGVLRQPELARVYAPADVFVFPSRTSTFGLVLLGTLASGSPVATYPVTGPIDVLDDPPANALREDLREACLEVLHVDRVTAHAHAEKFSWRAASGQFLAHLHPMPTASADNTTAAEPSTATGV